VDGAAAVELVAESIEVVDEANTVVVEELLPVEAELADVDQTNHNHLNVTYATDEALTR